MSFDEIVREKRRTNMAIKRDPYVIVFKCILMYTRDSMSSYAMKDSRRRITVKGHTLKFNYANSITQIQFS